MIEPDQAGAAVRSRRGTTPPAESRRATYSSASLPGWFTSRLAGRCPHRPLWITVEATHGKVDEDDNGVQRAGQGGDRDHCVVDRPLTNDARISSIADDVGGRM